jgi:large subunit ribosomal protein L9
MEVVLLQKIKNLGVLGDKVKVKPGYGRNYLIPQGKAVPATKQNIAAFEARRAELEQSQKDTLDRAEARAKHLREVSVIITAKVAMEGKLFGSVGTTEIIEAVKQQGVELTKQEIRLSSGPLRFVGDYEIAIHLHADVDSSIKVKIIPEK